MDGPADEQEPDEDRHGDQKAGEEPALGVAEVKRSPEWEDDDQLSQCECGAEQSSTLVVSKTFAYRFYWFSRSAGFAT